MNLELYPCSGGMAEGFKRAGIHFDLAVEWEAEHCDSYQANLGHRPAHMDVRELLWLCRDGFRFSRRIELVVADPPCTPWSRAGKRLGIKDERDMLRDTCELIELLHPDAYLIGNVPGLNDSTQWHHLQAALAPLAKAGYCIRDYTKLDAASFGVPQRRIRPFWFGHLRGPCVTWPMPTHCDQKELAKGTLGLHPMKPWRTCHDALSHLPLELLGRPVRLRDRRQPDCGHVSSEPDAPAHVIPSSMPGNGGGVLWSPRHRPASPASAIGAKDRGQSTCLLAGFRRDTDGHPTAKVDEPAPTIRGGGEGHSAPDVLLEAKKNHPISNPDKPAYVVKTNGDRASQAGSMLRLERPGHPPTDPDTPMTTITASGRGQQSMVRVGQGNRVGNPDEPSATVTAKASRVGAGEAHVLEWPWDRPSTTIARDERIPPPGHHSEYSIQSHPNAVVLSELAATILQGFPESWVFCGKTKRARWSQLGQAMPPPLAEAVARSVKRQMDATAAPSRSSPSPTALGPEPSAQTNVPR